MDKQNKNVKKLTVIVTILALIFAMGLNVSALTGSAAAEADSSYTLEEMLNYAIQDEYNARAEYQAIQAEFGVQRIYTNILKAEEQHVAELLPLFSTYGYLVPSDTSASAVVLPATLAETYAIGVTAEINNIAMYEKFLAQTLPDDVRTVFTELKNASESHLKAFENAVERTNLTASRAASRTGTRPETAGSQISRRGVSNRR